MESIPSVPLSTARGSQQQQEPSSSPISSPISPSPSVLIRAPLSSDDADPTSDAETLATADDDDGFETASDEDEPLPPSSAVMPIAQLTGDDEEVLDEGVPDVVPEDDVLDSAEGNPSLVDKAEVFEGAVEPEGEIGVLGGNQVVESPDGVLGGDPNTAENSEDRVLGGDPNPVEKSEDGVLGGNPNPVEDSEGGVLGGDPNPVENSEDSVLGGNPNPVEDSEDGVLGGDPNPVEKSEDGVLGGNPNPVEDSEDGVLGGSHTPVENSEDGDLGGSHNPVEDSKDGDVGDSPNLVEDSKDGFLGKSPDLLEDSKDEVADIEEGETAEPENLPKNLTVDEAIGTEAADSVVLASDSAVSDAEVVDYIKENVVPGAQEENLGGDSEGASNPVVERGSKAVDVESDPVEVKKDESLEETNRIEDADNSGLDEILEGTDKSKLGEEEASANEVEEIGADGTADANQNKEKAENDGDLKGGTIALGSELADDSAGKVDCQNDDEAIAGVEETEKDAPLAADAAPVALEATEDSAGQASFDLEAEAEANVTVLPVNGSDSGPVQEVESQASLVGDSAYTETEISQSSNAIKDRSFDVVSSESLPASVLDLEGNPAADVHVVDDDEKIEKEEEAEAGLVSDGPARVAILESSETAKQIIKEMEEGSSSTSTHSGFGSARDYSHNLDGQIASDSDEELLDSDEEGDGKELFDSAALAALLKAATGGSSDGNITIASSDASRIFSVDRPAGLGSSVPSLKPAPPRRPNLFTASDLAVAGNPEINMTEEERKLHDKVELIRVKFLRLVRRLGHSPDDTVAAQVLYRLGLAEGIRHGRQTSRAFSLENAKRKALELEMDGKNDLDFSCNILVLGKTGVGKSATINSIFGEEKSGINPFGCGTMSVKEIVGIVDGVKIRVIDTPGLKPSVMDQASNMRILSSIKKFTKRYTPDIVLYVDRVDTQTRDFNDLPLLKSITGALGSSIWFNAIVALTHAASAPPDGPSGSPMSYDVFVAQRSHVVQHSIRQAAGDMRLMNPVALVENHPSCRRNRDGERVLPNGTSWRPQMLLLCYSSKILSEANTLLKLQDPSPGKLFGFRIRSPPLPYLLSSLLQSRAHPKLSTDQGGDNGDSDVDLDDLSDADQVEEEDEYDELPPFKPLRKSQIAQLTKEQRRAYFDEYDYRVKLLQKKQWKEELRRMKEIKKRGKNTRDDFGYGEDDFDQDNSPAAVPVPLPDMVLPPSFDCDSPAYRYRFLEPSSQLLIRPVLDSHGWDHDCGYDGVSVEQNLAVLGCYPAGLAVQVTKDKKEFSVHLDSSVSAKHGESGSSLAGFDIQSIGKQLAYILRGETKFKYFKKHKSAAGMSVTFLGETVATGLKIEDQVSIGKRVSLVAGTGAVRAQGDMAYGANLEARLRDKDYPIGQSLSTLGLSLMRWRNDLALGANLQSQFSAGRNSKMVVRLGLNNKMSGQITVRTSTSESLQIALVGILPIAMNIYRIIWPGESISY